MWTKCDILQTDHTIMGKLELRLLGISLLTLEIVWSDSGTTWVVISVGILSLVPSLGLVVSGCSLPVQHSLLRRFTLHLMAISSPPVISLGLLFSFSFTQPSC